MVRKWKKAELKQYEKLLINERERILRELEYESDQIARTQLETSGDLAAYSNHMADQGTETERRELTSQIISSRRDTLFEVNHALRKITRGNYGVCEQCEKPIPKRRLKFLPHARLCITCSNKSH
ncbi:TraR/DksA C4-type zinc finger protein [candidate division WOR-3 bacterium]|nr:TraR/DksA C4-type zinc finger protein [candidate division WOR-3 bacterium]